jgi:hypothetical protein
VLADAPVPRRPSERRLLLTQYKASQFLRINQRCLKDLIRRNRIEGRRLG